eukprot:Em0001g864a
MNEFFFFQGPKEDTGHPGPGCTWSNWSYGTTWNKGDNSDTGPKEPQGAPGSKRAPGEPGAQGLTGPAVLRQGLKGDKGLPGNDRQIGAPGTNGYNGAKGNKGDTEVQGHQGHEGSMGDQEYKGDAGQPEQPGQTGTRGKDSQNGAKDEKGDQGPDGIHGAPGKDGAQVPPVPPGPDGPVGTPGPIGPEGDVGPQEPQGHPGSNVMKMSVNQGKHPFADKWSSAATPKGKKAMTVTEFRKLLGIMLSLTRTIKRRQDLWSSEDFNFPAPNFGLQFGISRNRLNDLLRYLRFCPADEYTNKKDKWSPVRRLIKGFNEQRAATFYPCWSICVDESMCAWRRKDENYCSDGMPHVTKIERKPKGVEVELMVAACAETKVMIALEIQEGREAMASKEYVDRVVGIGFNLEKNGARQRISGVGANYDKVKAGSQCLSDIQIKRLFWQDMNSSVSCVSSWLPNWSSLRNGPKSAVVDMAFNLGCAGVKKFKKMKAALTQSLPNYAQAAAQMKSSLWCKQGESGQPLPFMLCQVYRTSICEIAGNSFLAVNVATVQKQRGSDDCGGFAIAFALHAALGHCLEEIEFDQATMRDHLLKCYTTRNLTPFPTKKVKRARHTLIMNIDVFCSCQMPDTYGDMVHLRVMAEIEETVDDGSDCDDLVEEAYAYFVSKKYPECVSETKKRVIRRKAAKLTISVEGELLYKQQAGKGNEHARILEEAKGNIIAAQLRQKEAYDKKHCKPGQFLCNQLLLLVLWQALILLKMIQIVTKEANLKTIHHPVIVPIKMTVLKSVALTVVALYWRIVQFLLNEIPFVRMQFPTIDGWQSTLLAQNNGYLPAKMDAIQIHSVGFPLAVNVATVQKQRGSDDCGFFAIAFALHAALGHCLEEIEFDQATMRDHLLKCYTTRNLTPFPTKKVKRARHTLIMNIDVFCSCQMPDTYGGIWCSVVFANSGFTSKVESLLSTAKYIATDYRARLLPVTLEMLMFLKHNRRFWDVSHMQEALQLPDSELFDDDDGDDE